MTATIVWGTPTWFLPALVLSLAALAVLAWSYWRGSGVGAGRWLAATFKAVGLVLLIVCLLEPLWSGLRPRPGANQFAVLVDNSQSLQLVDPDSDRTRGERLQAQLTTEAPWQTRLAQDFDVRRYAFDARLRSVGDYRGLDFQGNASMLTAALGTLADRFRSRPLAGILVLSDGNATDATDLPADLQDWPPVYPIVAGSDRAARDVSLSRVAVTQTNFEAAPVTLLAEVAAAGYDGRSVLAELLDPAGQVVQKQTAVVSGQGRPLSFRFTLRPEQPEISFYQLRVAPLPDPGSDDTAQPEATPANNARLVMVDRGGGPYRVLYVGGRPNWEYKFLKRAVDSDPEIQLVGLLRIADREPKFNFLGRQGEETNPLFRGFQADSETAERYDQPVLLRLGTRDEQELREGFPTTEEDLFAWHAVILDDVEAAYFTHEQMLLLQRFVSRRGGGVLMLGGQESFAEGSYARTPLGDLLPVYLDRLEPSPAVDPRYRLQLTREGWLQTWIRLRETEPAEQNRLDAMPWFQSLNRTRSPKPGAVVLAELRDAQGARHPGLVAQRYGSGRSAALLVGDLWRWSLERPVDAEPDGAMAWRQTVRWLVADVPGRVEVDVQRRARAPGQPVELGISVRDERFQPLDNAAVTVRIDAPDGSQLEITAEPVTDRSGQYATSYVPRLPGGYRASVSVTAADGSHVGSAGAGWTSEPAADEFRELLPNRPLLERIAAATGGEVIEIADLDRLVADLPNRRVPIEEAWVSPLWHRPLVFLLAIGCLLGEWAFRRLKGMP